MSRHWHLEADFVMSQHMTLTSGGVSAFVMSQCQKNLAFVQNPVFVITQCLSQFQDQPDLIKIRLLLCCCDVTKSSISSDIVTSQKCIWTL